MNTNIFGLLPEELIQIIISYNDNIVYRNGKYMNRIIKTDTRYKMLKTIPRPIYFSPTSFSLWFEYKSEYKESNYNGYCIYYNYNVNNGKMSMIKLNNLRNKYCLTQIIDPNYSF